MPANAVDGENLQVPPVRRVVSYNRFQFLTFDCISNARGAKGQVISVCRQRGRKK